MDNPWILVGSKKTSGGHPSPESYITTDTPSKSSKDASSSKEPEKDTPWGILSIQIELGIQVLIEKDFQQLLHIQRSGNATLYKHDWMHI